MHVAGDYILVCLISIAMILTHLIRHLSHRDVVARAIAVRLCYTHLAAIAATGYIDALFVSDNNRIFVDAFSAFPYPTLFVAQNYVRC